MKSEKAIDTTIDIVETFAQMHELSNMVAELVKSPDETQKQAAVMQKSSEILSDMVTDVKCGKIGTQRRDEFEEQAQYYVISEMLKETRKEAKMFKIQKRM